MDIDAQKLALRERRREKLVEILTTMKQAELSRKTGVSQSYISRCLLDPDDKNAKNIGEDIVRKFETGLGKKEGWYDARTHTSYITTQVPAATPINLTDNPDFPAVRRVRFKLSAGASGFTVDYIDDDAAPIVFRREWFDHHGYIPGKLLAIKVANGSMEPVLYHGDTVIVNTGDSNITDGEVFAMNYEGELVIKRLVRDAGQWWLASDNPDQRRYPRKVCNEDVFCLGKIVLRQSERI